MGIGWTPGWTLVLVIPCAFILLVATYAVRKYIRSRNTSHNTDIERRSRTSYTKIDASLQQSLYADPLLNPINPRDTTAGLILTSSKYATPSPSRPQSLHPSYRSRNQNVTDIADMRRALCQDSDTEDEDDFEPGFLSRPSSRPASVYNRSSRSTQRASYSISNPQSRRSSRHSTVRTSLSEGRYLQHNQFEEKPFTRSHSQSPHRSSYARKSMDVASVHSRRSTTSHASIRHALYADDDPASMRPEVPGISPFLTHSRDSYDLSSRLPTMTTTATSMRQYQQQLQQQQLRQLEQQQPQYPPSSYPSPRSPHRSSYPADRAPRDPADITFANLRALPVGSEFVPDDFRAPMMPTTQSPRGRRQHNSWSPDADVPPVPPLPLNWMMERAFSRERAVG